VPLWNPLNRHDAPRSLRCHDLPCLSDDEDDAAPEDTSRRRNLRTGPCDYARHIVPDGLESVRDARVDLCDRDGADLVPTTGGTGPAPRDLTPEAMEQVCHKVLPGFGKLMRRVSLAQVPTAMLSRQTAGVRGHSLIVNLPGKPSAIAICLAAVFPAVPDCLELIGAERIELSAEFDVAGRAVQLASR